MAPSKRAADGELEDHSDAPSSPSSAASRTTGLRNAGGSAPRNSHSLSNIQNKRRRISDESEDTPRGGSSDTDMDEDPDTPASELDPEEELAATQAATQSIREKRDSRKDLGNEPAECGILEEVELENFMCHKNYSFRLNPLINFICGRNGSGKSAILTAIVICLGGKASSTNRGGSLKDFIRTGSDHATVICKLKNEGSGGYMPEAYGRTIVVERHWTRGGSSGFKLKSATGRIISTKKGDLEEICDHFSLQIDNPLNVLSQDNARQFLSSSNPAEKYKFFVKGVQLEQLDQDYRLIEDQKDNIEAKIQARLPDLAKLKEKRDRAKEKFDLMQKHSKIDERLGDLRRQMVWAQIVDYENELAQATQDVEEMDAKILEIEQRIASRDAEYQEAVQQYEAGKEVHEQAKAVTRTSEEEVQEKRAARDEAKNEMSKAQAEQRHIKSVLTDLNKSIEAQHRDIEAEQERLTGLNGGGAAERLRQLEKSKDNLETARRDRQNHPSRKAALDKELADAATLVKESQNAVIAKAADIERLQGDLSSARQSGTARDAAFGNSFPLLLREIKKERNFVEEPIGPIGKYVKLQRPEWSSILEKVFGGSLNSFLVTTKDDMNTLRAIMRRVRCELPVVIANRAPIDTRPQEPDESFVTIDRVLEISHEIVRKQLVIAHGIEQTILIHDVNEASNIMFRSGSRLNNVKQCFCMNPENKRKGIRLSYTSQGGASQDPVHEFNGLPRMGTDTGEHVQYLEEALQEAKNHRVRLLSQQTEATNRHVKAQQALKRYGNESNQLRLAVDAAEDEVSKLTEAIQEDNVESGKLDVLRTNLTRAEENRSVNEELYQDAYSAVRQRAEKLSAAQAALDEAGGRHSDIVKAEENALFQCQEFDKLQTRHLYDKNNEIERKESEQKSREELVAHRNELQEQLVENTAKAERVSRRVNTEGETYEGLKSKWEKLRKDQALFERQLGANPEAIRANLTKTDEEYKKARSDISSLKNLSVKLGASIIERRHRWTKFRSLISVRAKAQFTYLLSERNFRGTLMTDHKQKLLDIRVEPDITKRDGRGRGARTLSGGEKSFSQICLLLAIWEAMGSPIRCLDEFDVFMDAVNRTQSVNLLIEAARQSIGRQYVLISPGTKNDIKKASDVSAQEVAPPERGQRTIDSRALVSAAA